MLVRHCITKNLTCLAPRCSNPSYRADALSVSITTPPSVDSAIRVHHLTGDRVTPNCSEMDRLILMACRE